MAVVKDRSDVNPPAADDRAAPPPAFLKALGRRRPPQTLVVAGAEYQLARVFKHDFFAVTSMYEGENGRVVLKLNRQAALGGAIPLRWIGRILARREAALFERVRGVEGVPRFLGRWGDTGVLHEYVAGHAMHKGECVPDDFHARLRGVVDELHRRDVAYVDLEKCENVIVGDDGRPYLVDFQIAWYWPRRWGGELFPFRALRRRLQAGDRYHLVKLQRRTRPDQLTPAQREDSYRRPWPVRFYNRLTRPITLLRRSALERLDPRRGPGGSPLRGESERGRLTH